MNTRFLATLCAVADTGSLAGAARVLRLSSATVAEQIQALERSLGVSLIRRQGRTVALTDEGRAVVSAGRDILIRVADLTQVAQLGRLKGTLRIGSVSTALVSIVPPAMKRICDDYPEIALNIVPGTSGQLFRMLDAREIDCAITPMIPSALAKEFGWRLIRREPLTLIGPEDFGGIGINECLRTRPLIRMYRNSPTGQIISRFLTDRGVEVRELFEIEAAEMIVMLVAQGLGVSLLPDYGFQSGPNRTFRKIVIEDPAYSRDVGILYRRGAREALVDVFFAALKET